MAKTPTWRGRGEGGGFRKVSCGLGWAGLGWAGQGWAGPGWAGSSLGSAQEPERPRSSPGAVQSILEAGQKLSRAAQSSPGAFQRLAEGLQSCLKSAPRATFFEKTRWFREAHVLQEDCLAEPILTSFVAVRAFLGAFWGRLGRSWVLLGPS